MLKVRDYAVLKELVQDESLNLGELDVSGIPQMPELFAESERKDFSGIEKWNMSEVYDMTAMFYNARWFNHPINRWDVSAAEGMGEMFSGAESFNQPLDRWNTCGARVMRRMFAGAKSFCQDISTWDVQWVVDFSGMFQEAEAFNCDLSTWNVGCGERFMFMFMDARSFDADISNWSVDTGVPVAYRRFLKHEALGVVEPGNPKFIDPFVQMFSGAEAFLKKFGEVEPKEYFTALRKFTERYRNTPAQEFKV